MGGIYDQNALYECIKLSRKKRNIYEQNKHATREQEAMKMLHLNLLIL